MKAQPRRDLVGTLVGGKYRLTGLIGQGGMGAVYEARHELVGRRFAIKFLLPELAMRKDILTRFRREAQAAGALENENIAAVTDFGVAEDGSSYIVMEYLQGEDLSRLLARLGPLPISRAVCTVIQACRGLMAAHAANIVHRDLKPGNLFVAQRGDGTDLVKVLDFGIAKLRLDEHAGSDTSTGVTLGTPHYMPPEQARGERALDHRADIYALGVILYELLSGRKPHDGRGYNAILFQILTQSCARLETVCPGVPLGLADVVHRAMAAEPASRYQSVSALIEALTPFTGTVLERRHLSNERLAASPVLPHGTFGGDTETSAPSSLELQKPLARNGAGAKARRKLFWIGAAVLIGAAATLSFAARETSKLDVKASASETVVHKAAAGLPPTTERASNTSIAATVTARPAPGPSPTTTPSANAKPRASQRRPPSSVPRSTPTPARNSPSVEDLYAP